MHSGILIRFFTWMLLGMVASGLRPLPAQGLRLDAGASFTPLRQRILESNAPSMPNTGVAFGTAAALRMAPGRATRTDVNGDGTSDLIWRHGAAGDVYVMPMRNGSPQPGAVVWQEQDAQWQIVGSGDLNGDGRADLIWWNRSSGLVWGMLLNGPQVLNGGALHLEPDTQWQIQAVADFDGDGIADLLWRHASSGIVYLMPMQGFTQKGGAVVWVEPNQAWQILGAGDFNGDGKADILWRHGSSGMVYIQLMNGTTVTGGRVLYQEPNPDWVLEAIADLDGNGTDDLVWRHQTSGQVYVLPVVAAEAQPQSGGVVWTEADPAWQIAAVGDFDGDGREDLLWWHRTTGRVFLLLMQGTTVKASSLVYQEPDVAWGLQGRNHPVEIQNPVPPSTLLPAGSRTLDLRVQTNRPATLRWSVGALLDWNAMQPFSEGQGTTAHRTLLAGLNPDPKVVNHVYIRADAPRSAVLHLIYRALPNANPEFPRTGNLWGTWDLFSQGGLPNCAKRDLLLGADFTPDEIVQLRTLNPNILILDSINTVEVGSHEHRTVPDSYWLRDTRGNRIEVWPGGYRLNLTKPEVALFQAKAAHQKIVDSGLHYDGVFFDNFFITQSNLKEDIWGNPVAVDANEDGLPDDPVWLDTAWKAGVYAELNAWRELMPWAITMGHLPDPTTSEIGSVFNGDSIGIKTAGIKDGTRHFLPVWNNYHSWYSLGKAPVVTMFEASPPDEIAYGYGYSPLQKIPPTTLEFARTYYPYMRFGLGLTLMNDGYFAHEFGDTDHGQNWWYDELDFKLGYPRGASRRVDLGITPTTDYIANGGFEDALSGTWTNWVNAAAGCVASFSRVTQGQANGAACLKVDITNPGQSQDWHIALFQMNRSLTQKVFYDIEFWARATGDHPVRVSLQKGSPDWHGYGLSASFTLGTEWKRYTATFEALETVTDARLSINLGARAGTVWLDDVKLTQHPPDVFSREYDRGLVVLNGTRERQLVPIPQGFSRLTGTQAPLVQQVVDDAEAAFSFTGGWVATTLDSGQWKATGPWYHDWGSGCHQLSGTDGQAEWRLDLPMADTYTLDLWWPAGPAAAGWSTQVVAEVVAGGAVVASATFDQTQGGDQWHRIGQLALDPAQSPRVRLRNLGTGVAIADAVLVQSAARYNNGLPVSEVRLEPLDAIVLRRNPQ